MAALYRGYDRAGLDRQFNLRAVVAEAETLMAQGTAWSERTRAERRCRLDLRYGSRPEETLNVFPAERKRAPLHLFIHGGYWQRMDKADFDFVADGLVPAGVTLVNVNYTLAPAVTIGEIVRQVRAAVAWTWRNADELGGDRERITVSGHSAGGHLTAMAVATDWPAFDPALPADLLKGGCAISGIYDLEPIRLCYLNEVLGLDAAEARANSPLTRIPAASPPLRLCVGGGETDEFRRQQAAFAAARADRGLAGAVVEMPGHNHFTVVMALGEPDTPLNRAVLDLVAP